MASTYQVFTPSWFHFKHLGIFLSLITLSVETGYFFMEETGLGRV